MSSPRQRAEDAIHTEFEEALSAAMSTVALAAGAIRSCSDDAPFVIVRHGRPRLPADPLEPLRYGPIEAFTFTPMGHESPRTLTDGLNEVGESLDQAFRLLAGLPTPGLLWDFTREVVTAWPQIICPGHIDDPDDLAVDLRWIPASSEDMSTWAQPLTTAQRAATQAMCDSHDMPSPYYLIDCDEVHGP